MIFSRLLCCWSRARRPPGTEKPRFGGPDRKVLWFIVGDSRPCEAAVLLYQNCDGARRNCQLHSYSVNAPGYHCQY
eukprot:3936199-Rhodomonas_salina.1